MITRNFTRNLSTQALQVVNDVAKQRFAVTLHGHVATLEYQKSSNKITFVHTAVPEVFQGKGVGKLLAKDAFDYAHNNKLNVTCQCGFLEKYYKENKAKYPGLKIQFELA